MDQALRITWYDLPDDRRDAYLSWLHDVHMPRLTQRAGVLWAAHYASEPKPLHTTKKKPRRYPAPDSVAARNENFVDHESRNHPEQAAWSEKVTGQVVHAPGSPNVARRIASVVAAN